MQEEGGSQATVVPCGDPTALVESLKRTILERLCGERAGPSDQYTLSLAGCTQATLSEKDVIQEVLRDGDCLLLKSQYKTI